MSRLAWVLAGLFVVGCQAGIAPTSPPSASPTVSASPSPSASPDLGCHQERGRLELPTPTLEYLQTTAQAVVVGSFLDFGAPIWNTPDGAPPSLATFRQGRAEIRTPLSVAAATVLRGDGSAAEHIVLAHEGKIGCVHFSGYVTPILGAGSPYVFWLWATRNSSGEPDDDLAGLVLWPVDSAGMAHTGYDGLVPLKDLVTLLSASPSTPASPSAQPPTPS